MNKHIPESFRRGVLIQPAREWTLIYPKDIKELRHTEELEVVLRRKPRTFAQFFTGQSGDPMETTKIMGRSYLLPISVTGFTKQEALWWETQVYPSAKQYRPMYAPRWDIVVGGYQLTGVIPTGHDEESGVTVCTVDHTEPYNAQDWRLRHFVVVSTPIS